MFSDILVTISYSPINLEEIYLSNQVKSGNYSSIKEA